MFGALLAAGVTLAAPQEDQGEESLEGFAEDQIAVEVELLVNALEHYQPSGKKQNKLFTIVILYNQNVKTNLLDELEKAFQSIQPRQVQGRKLTIMRLAYKDAETITSEVRSKKIDAVFFPEGMKRQVLPVLSVTRKLGVLSLTDQADYVHWLGVCLGVDTSMSDLASLESEEAHKIMVNLSSCPLEKSSFAEALVDKADVFF